MNVAKTVNIFNAVKKGQENEKTAKTVKPAKRQGKAIKVILMDWNLRLIELTPKKNKKINKHPKFICYRT